jgi:hypothetical protein
MFLVCPAYLDQEGTVRCGLPTEVRRRYTMRSTDGPLECVMIGCPSGHWFNGPIASLTCESRLRHDPFSTAVASSAERDSRTGGLVRLDGSGRPAVRDAPVEPWRPFSRPNGAPPYYLGRPAQLWITAMTPGRRRAASAASMEALTDGRERTLSPRGAPFADAGAATACAAPASTTLLVMEDR